MYYVEADGGAEEDRTPDLRIANAALSQLSYGPITVILPFYSACLASLLFGWAANTIAIQF